jgi:ligand-binding sensor domain-containing protein
MTTRSKARWLLLEAATAAVTLLLASGAWALAPELRIAQLYHTAWTAADGAPTGIESLAQTSDGYLWIAGAAGLFRFDGIRFERIDNIRGQRLPSTNIVTLFAPADGGLWIGYRFGGASFIRGGRVTHYSANEGLPGGSVTRFAHDSSRTMWANTTHGLRRLEGARWVDVRQAFNLPSERAKTALSVARDGSLWVVIGHEVMYLPRGGAAFVATNIRTSDEEVDFVEAPDGSLWVTDEELGARAVYAPDTTTARDDRRHNWVALKDPVHGPLWGKLIDRDGVLWTASSTGIHRVKDVGRLLDRAIATDLAGDAFSSVDGLTAPYASAFLEDREGNVWIGTTGGLDRFRQSRLTPVELPHAANGFAIAAGDAGALVTGIDFQAGAFRVTAPGSAEPLAGPQFVGCAYRADDGVVWLGGRARLWRSSGADRDSKWVAIDVPVDRATANYFPVQAIVQDRSERLWVSVVRGGVFRLAAGQWTHFGNAALSLAAAQDGRVLLGYPQSRMTIVDTDTDVVREFSPADGLDLGNVMAILPTATGAWVGGELGLARFDGQRFHAVTPSAGGQLPSISGIVATPNGDLWLSSSAGAIRMPSDEARRLAANPRYAVRYELFDFLDGMPGTPNAMRPLPSIAATSDGRLWFATSNGIAWIHPNDLRRNALAPNVEVQSIVADGETFDVASGLELPVNPRNVQISYTALSLSIPERVRFRYQLGADQPWQDAGARRAAFFTDLGPGDYTFRVAAANNDGVWNEAGASVEFTILPAFYQTLWFYAVCALAGVGLLGALYAVRVRQVAAHVRDRLEARLAERERIARDLHDTLLQGMQGLIWRFQAASDRIPAGASCSRKVATG